jgi:ubiquinone/menaquinone biosynthesis C-methylase UbiE
VLVSFVVQILNQLMAENLMTLDHSILAVCAEKTERDVLSSMGFSKVTISNVDKRLQDTDFSPYNFCCEDAQRLSFEDDYFDYAIVSSGLHHCRSPHRALLEMYRVSKKGVIVVEARDCLLVRLGIRLRLVEPCEISAVMDAQGQAGGVENTGIPNFVYRWTEREFEKVISSYNPIGRHSFRYFYRVDLSPNSPWIQQSSIKLFCYRVAEPFVKLLGLIAKKQGNRFGMVALKPQIPDDLWPWLEVDHGVIKLSERYLR